MTAKQAKYFAKGHPPIKRKKMQAGGRVPGALIGFLKKRKKNMASPGLGMTTPPAPSAVPPGSPVGFKKGGVAGFDHYKASGC